METTEIRIGKCHACGEYFARYVGRRYGDGQTDTDESPIWLSIDGITDRFDDATLELMVCNGCE